MLDRITKPFIYWLDLYREIRIWAIFRRTANEHEKMLNEEHGLRVDWLGRIYGVINLPEEVRTAAPQIQEAYSLQQITKYGKVMMKIGLADIVYPEVSRIPESVSYLVVLWPEYESLTFWKIVGNLIRTSIIGFLGYLGFKIIFNNLDQIIEYVNLTLETVKSIL